MLKALRWPFLAQMTAAVLLVGLAVGRPAAPRVTTEALARTSLGVSDKLPQAEATPLPVAPVDALGAPPAAGQNVLVEALVGDIRKLNPLLATYNPVDRDITALIFEGLTTTDDYGQIVPDLAASWTISQDGLEYLVTLRDDALWQDGVPFTADDVVYTVSVMSDPHFPGAAMLHQFWRTVEADAVSSTMVRFRLTQPLASFPDYMRIGIVPAHVLQGTSVEALEYHPFNLSPIGTGPYQLEERYATNGQIDGVGLRVAPVYRQRPEGQDGYQLDRVIFRTYATADDALQAFERGDANSIGDVPPEALPAARRVPDLSLYTAIAPEIGVLIYNWESDAMRFVRNPRARLALAYALNRPALVDEYLSGRAVLADSPLLPTSWAYEPGLEWPGYDPARAQALLDTADLTFEVPAEGVPAPDDATAAGEGESSGEAAETDTGESSGELAAAESAEPPTEQAPPAGETPAATMAPDGGAPAATPQATLAPDGGAPDSAPEATPEGEATATAEPTATPEPTPEPLTFTLLTRDDPALVGIAEEIAAAWNALGFHVTVESANPEELLAQLEACDFGAALIELSFEPSADPDSFVFWHQGQYQRGQNYGGMDDRRVSEALEMGRREPYGINRVNFYRTFQEMFAERAPAQVLYYPLYVYAADEGLEGVQFGFLSSPADRFRHIKDWAFRAE